MENKFAEIFYSVLSIIRQRTQDIKNEKRSHFISIGDGKYVKISIKEDKTRGRFFCLVLVESPIH
ncbi:MAG: hypothetical protein KGZ94_08130 [Clostridia bacterium]|nr:hypothetical protein [Clostridia bacterium]